MAAHSPAPIIGGTDGMVIRIYFAGNGRRLEILRNGVVIYEDFALDPNDFNGNLSLGIGLDEAREINNRVNTLIQIMSGRPV